MTGVTKEIAAEREANGAEFHSEKRRGEPITQEQLDLCRLGMVMARTQLMAMVAGAKALEQPQAANEFETLQMQFADLCTRIHTGEICAATR